MCEGSSRRRRNMGDDKRRICLNRSMSGMESVGTGNLGFAALERPADAAWTRGAEDGI